MLRYILPFPITVLALLPLLTSIAAQSPGKTTRYWDCCKPSCAWPRDGITAPVRACTGYDVPLKDVNAKSSCDGGEAYTCSDQTPWAVSDTLAYGFASVSAAGGDGKCCGCYELSFTSGPVVGKTMVVQATNTGGDVSSTQFDIAVSLFSLLDPAPQDSVPSVDWRIKDANSAIRIDTRWRRWYLRRLLYAMGRQ